MSEFLIIGDGLAGINMAWTLYKRGLSFTLVSDHGPKSSIVAAGIINPVIGRKFNYTWRYDDIYDTFMDRYAQMPFENPFQSLPILRALKTVLDINEFSLREQELLDRGVITERTENRDLGAIDLPVKRWIEVLKSGRLDTLKFINESIAFFSRMGCFKSDRITASDLVVKEKHLKIERHKSKYVIFSEGIPMPSRNLLPTIPIIPQKGEVLIFQSFQLPEDIIVKYKYFIVPLGEQKFWLGSNYDWHSEDYRLPSEQQYGLMSGFLNELGPSDIQILLHKIGYRPTIKDRMPVIGKIPPYENAFVLNGMGSKGASLAPYCSELLFDGIMNGQCIPKEVNLSRFKA